MNGRRKTNRFGVTIVSAVVAIALLGGERSVSAGSSVTSSSRSNGTCMADSSKDIEYLIFWPPLPGEKGDDDESRVRSLVARLKTTGDGRTRQLGFGAMIPVWAASPKRIVNAIRQNFAIAQRTGVAVHFNVDDHIEWDERPDLWNWYDPTKPGYNPENRKNVEWYDWAGTPNKRRYITPNGAPSQSPHMCYNSAGVQKAIRQIISEVVGPELQRQITQLHRENKEYLFAGITVGSEPGFDDYSMIPQYSPMLPLMIGIEKLMMDPLHRMILSLQVHAAEMMDEDNAPHNRLGYCALTIEGYSAAHPPADVNHALIDIIRQTTAFWDSLFVDAGLSCSRIYTHVPAPAEQDDHNAAPIGVAFNPDARPGWTTYPQGPLEHGLEPIYRQLDRHGDPAWGGVEANATLGNAVPWERYLGWQYNHGAKLVGISIGAADASLMSSLSKGAFSDEAVKAYRKFLRGEKLSEQ